MSDIPGRLREEFRVGWFCSDGRAGTIPFQDFPASLRDARRLNALESFDAHVERRVVSSWQVCEQAADDELELAQARPCEALAGGHLHCVLQAGHSGNHRHEEIQWAT